MTTFFFAHLQGLDKATRPHLAQFDMHSMHFCIPQVIKKKFTYLLKAEQPKKKSRFSPSPPTSTAEQGGAGSLSSVREGGG